MLRQSSGYHKRKANYEADSYEKITESGFDITAEQDGFADSEMEIYLARLGLTERELQICRMITKDCLTKSEMARVLKVTPTTINYYAERIKKKLRMVV
jgi:DNA-binding CsgD family transcriptional regulator